MDSPFSKHRRKYGTDIISGLPDAICIHILSFLPTKDAVRTTSLSKRWTHVWMSVPNVQIDDDDSSLLSSDCTNSSDPKFKTSFMDFVERVLELNDVSCLRKLSLSCDKEYDLQRVSLWITTAMMRDVVELDLGLWKLAYYERIERPDVDCSAFFSKKLVILKLRDWDNIILKVPQLVHLHSLKILHLRSVRFVDKASMNNLIDNCPVLEELDIKIDCRNVEKTLSIRSTSLKSLRLDTKYFSYPHSSKRIVVDAKNLERLHLMDDTTVLYDLNNLPSLVKLNLDCYELFPLVRRREVHGKQKVEILNKSFNTKYMLLSSEIMKTLEYAQLNDLLVFPNLTHLELNTFDYSWPVLPYLLECSPNLLTLVINKELSKVWRFQFRTAEFLMLNLKDIEVTGFKASADEMEMVKYFLETAKVLKKFSIQCYYTGTKKQSEILKKLLMFPRGSTECQIIFN